MILKKDFLILLKHPLFQNLEPNSTLSILRANDCAVCKFESGDVICSPAATQKKAGIILNGRASVSALDGTKNSLLRFLKVGDLFGISNFFTVEPFVSMIRADKPTRVLFLTEAAIAALMDADRDFLYRYLSFLSGRICFLNKKIGYLTAGTAERRLALYLTSFMTEEVVLTESLTVLSELLNLGRASLYRAFDRLIADGYIQKYGHTIHIFNLEAMRKAYQ